MLTRIKLWVQRYRLQRIHKRLALPSALTFNEYERLCGLLGFNPDRVLQVEGEAQKMLNAELTYEKAQEFLDITHPKHGVNVRMLRMEDLERLCAVCVANFTFASVVNLNRHTKIVHN
jgi:hypothetical protein